MKKVIGIGNALTDMLVNLQSDAVLSAYGIAKGSMSLVNSALQSEISKSVAGFPTRFFSVISSRKAGRILSISPTRSEFTMYFNTGR